MRIAAGLGTMICVCTSWINEWKAASLVLLLISGALLHAPSADADEIMWPLAGGQAPISVGFFDPDYPKAWSPPAQHLGIDIPAADGEEVLAPVSGIVVINETDRSEPFQMYLVIRDAITGEEHVLGHIESQLPVTALVVAGDVVGIVRRAGTGPHLHWGINTIGVAQSMGSGWGWGRAPQHSSRADAFARGWVDPLDRIRRGSDGANRSGVDCQITPTRACVQDEALAAVRQVELEDADAYEWLLNQICVELARTGRIAEALTLARGADRGGAIALGRIAAAHRDPSIFAEALSVARGDGHQQTRALAEIAAAQAEAGFFTEALRTARSIAYAEDRETALSLIVEAQANAGLFAEALATIGSGDVWWREMALANIAVAQAKAGLLDDAWATLRGVVGAETRSYIIFEIAAAHSEVGRFTEALATARSIADPSYRARALGHIAAAQRDSAIFAEGLETARGVENEFLLGGILEDLAAFHASGGYVAEALGIARGLTGHHRVEALRRIAAAYSDTTIFAEAVLTVDEIEFEHLRPDYISDIAASQAEVGFVTEALALAHGIKDATARAKALVRIAAAMGTPPMFIPHNGTQEAPDQ